MFQEKMNATSFYYETHYALQCLNASTKVKVINGDEVLHGKWCKCQKAQWVLMLSYFYN